MTIQSIKAHQGLSQLRHHISTLVSILVSTGLLLGSWYVWYLALMALTEGWGAPWDTTDIRPPVGHWQRTLNDFFESGIGAYLPAITLIVISFLIYIHAVARTQQPQATSAFFGFTNFVALFAIFLVAYLLQVYLIRTPAHLTAEEWSYWGDFRREWPLSLTTIGCFGALFLLQPYWLRAYLHKRVINSSLESPSHRDSSSS